MRGAWPARAATLLRRPRAGRLQAALALASSLAVVALLAPPAQAAPLSEDFSAADQYVESVPTSKGPHPATGRGEETAPLPPGVGGRLEGETGAELRQVATSSRLGAPQHRLPDTGEPSPPSIPSAATSAIDDGGSGWLIWLVFVLLAVTGVVAGTAGHRHYKQRKATGGA
jgi:hypothetical protein